MLLRIPAQGSHSNALRSEGVSKTAGILGKLSQIVSSRCPAVFLMVPLSGAWAVAGYFRTPHGCIRVPTHPGTSLRGIWLGMEPWWDRAHTGSVRDARSSAPDPVSRIGSLSRCRFLGELPAELGFAFSPQLLRGGSWRESSFICCSVWEIKQEGLRLTFHGQGTE